MTLKPANIKGIQLVHSPGTFKKVFSACTLILLVALFQSNLNAQSINVTTVSATPACAGANVTISFDVQNGSGSPKAFDNNTTYYVYLSNSNGTGYVLNSTFSTSGQSYTIGNGAYTYGLQRSITIPAGTTFGTGYKIAVGSANPGFDASTGAGASNAFTINVIPTITGTTPASRCGTGTLTLSASASAGSVSWFAASSGGTALATGAIYTTPSIASTTSYWVETTNSGCTSATRTQVIATINSTPSVTSTTPASRCGTGTLTLSATPSAGRIEWFTASTGGTTIYTGTSFTTPSLSSTTSYWVDALNNGCTPAVRTQVIATINSIPTITGTTAATRCGPGTLILSATASLGTVYWYATSVGGASLGSGASFTTPAISTTTSYWAEAVNAGCTSATRTQVTATVNDYPVITGTTAGSRCSTGTITLSATSSVGTISWHSTATGSTFLASGSSFTTPPISSTTSYWVDATANGCTNTSKIQVIATVNDLPTITGTTPASRCGSGTVTLSATASAGTINWYAAATGGSSLGTGASFTTASISSTTTYYAGATASGCTSSVRAAVTATVNQSTGGTVSANQSICNNTQPGTALTLSGHIGSVVKWQRSTTPGFATATDIANTTTTLSTASMGNLMATTYFRAVVQNGACPPVYSDYVTIAVINTNTWTGAVSADWNNAANWTCYVPVGINDIVIASGLNNFPNLSDGAPGRINNITIQSGATLTISNNNLRVSGIINNSGTLDVSNGAIEFDGATGQTIPANIFKQNRVKDLVINNNVSVSLAGGLKVTGTLWVNKGTLITGDSLSLNSDSAGTARIAELPVDGSGVATSFINGKVTMERYLPARKAWRLLSAPVYEGNAPTINEAWQEGVTTAADTTDVNPGYGVFIQGGTETNGFDKGATSNASIKIYSNSANNFVALPAIPGTNAPITSYPGYFLYVRGDRGINLLAGNAAATTAATLRVTGNINTGKITSAVNATNYTVLGNPYPSAIDFATINRANVKNSFYAWDPKLAGAFGLGAYVAFIWNDVTSSYDATSSESALTQYIQSGAAIIIESEDGLNPGQVTIKESDKTADGSDIIFGFYKGPAQKLRVDLYGRNANATTSLLDGILTTFADGNKNIVDRNDATKLSGASESIGLKRNGSMLAIERRATVTDNDTSFLNLYQMKIGNYELVVTADNLDANNTVAVLKDSYSNTTNNLLLNPNGSTVVPFNINYDPKSYAVGRFSIVYTSEAVVVLPVTIKTIKANRLPKAIAVEWTTENEINVKHYEVERSFNGSDFTKIYTTLAIATNGGSAVYKFIDADPAGGYNYYRIRSVDVDGKPGYSEIVKVDSQSNILEASIEVYPNPVTGKTITYKINNLEEGNYTLQLFNSWGQMISSKTIYYSGIASVRKLEVKRYFTAGKYDLVLKGEAVKINTSILKK